MSVAPLKVVSSGWRKDIGSLSQVSDSFISIEDDFIRIAAEMFDRPDFIQLMKSDPARLEAELEAELERAWRKNYSGVKSGLATGISAAYASTFKDADKILKAAQESGLISASSGGYGSTMSRYAQATLHRIERSIDRMGFTARDSIIRNVLHNAAINRAIGNVQTKFVDGYAIDRFAGAPITLQGAIDNAIADLAQRGVEGHRYPNGQNISLEPYVRREIETQTYNGARNMQWDIAKDMGTDLIIVSAHAGARPGCYPYQGQVYTTGDIATEKFESIYNTSYGEPAGLFGINCRHWSLPFVEGMNTEYDFEEQDPALMLAPGADGHVPTNNEIYEATQKQRYYERQIRGYKREAERFDAANDNAGATGARARVKAYQAKQRQFIDDQNTRGIQLTRQYGREATAFQILNRKGRAA
jgi:hypothetical protein